MTELIKLSVFTAGSPPKQKLKKKIVALTILVNAMLTIACSTPEKGALLGASIGAGTGLMVVSNSSPNDEGRIMAAASGALLGGAIGYFATKNKIKKDAQSSQTNTKLDQVPKLIRPEVRRVWVPDEISGDEYSQGHWKFIIDKNSVWSREPTKE